MFAESQTHHLYTKASSKIFHTSDQGENRQRGDLINFELTQDQNSLQQSTTQETL